MTGRALVTTQAEFPPGGSESAAHHCGPEGGDPHCRGDSAAQDQSRRTRYRLRDAAARIVSGRVARCGRVRVAETVTIRSHAGRCSASGFETCGSIWSCPVCAGKIARERQGEVRHAMTEWGGAVYMMAFTSPHYRGDDLKALRQRIAGAWRKMASGAPWGRLRAAYGLRHSIRALEVTWGQANGWHPHLHVLLFLDAPLAEDDRAEFEAALFDRWNRIGEREGAKPCRRDLFRLERVATPEAAGDYVAKWGADHEITHLHSKRAKGGGLTPWDLLDMAAKGGARARRLFQTYTDAMFRARHLTWSRGFKSAVGLDERADEDVAAEVNGEAVVILDGKEADRVRKAGKWCDLLEAAERGGAPAAIALLERVAGRLRTDEANARRSHYFGEGDHVGVLQSVTGFSEIWASL